MENCLKFTCQLLTFFLDIVQVSLPLVSVLSLRAPCFIHYRHRPLQGKTPWWPLLPCCPLQRSLLPSIWCSGPHGQTPSSPLKVGRLAPAQQCLRWAWHTVEARPEPLSGIRGPSPCLLQHLLGPPWVEGVWPKVTNDSNILILLRLRPRPQHYAKAVLASPPRINTAGVVEKTTT